MGRWTAIAVALACPLLLSGCGDDDGSSAPAGGYGGGAASSQGGGESSQRFPELLEAEATETGDGSYEIAVTISSPYDSPDRYANGWRVLGPDGEVIAEHELLHDHASEQPFTRVQTGVEIDPSIETVTIEGRDLENGYGGETLELSLRG